MPQDVAFDAEGFVRAAIDDLRRNLLDFSTRNRLLSFKHQHRAVDHFRVVDELPGAVYRRLTGGKMRFKPLPPIEMVLPDEASEEFEGAVAILREKDDIYRKWSEENKAAAEAPFEVERALRDKARVELGRQPLLYKGKIDLTVYAEAHGVRPDYDLPVADNDKHAKHSDNHIQTLLLEDDLLRRGRKLFERYTDHLQEKGINVLYAAFGFLEWFEDDISDTAHHAPLLLLPLSMARTAEHGRMDFDLSSESSDLEVNATLVEFLKKDFHLNLPPFINSSEADQPRPQTVGGASSSADAGSDADVDTLEKWLEQVAAIISGKRRWKIRRYVTIGTFPFSRISLYKDLDVGIWPENGLVEHDIVAKLLGGRGRFDGEESVGEAPDYPLDAPAFVGRVPPLVLDADSSQHSAIVDAVEGHSMVVQGPPGTGKSQTIANMIAAALDGGKRVLFVAEKSAALNVVASRLRHCGFGPFLLELHSDKAKKADVIASLKERLELQSSSPIGELERKLDQQRSARDRLGRYVELMAGPVGRLGRSLHELMWHATRWGDELEGGSISALSKSKVAHGLTIDVAELEAARGALSSLAEARDRIIASSGSVNQHPWNGLKAANPFLIEDIVEHARCAEATLSAVVSTLAELRAQGVPLPDTITGLTRWVEEISRIPEMKGDAPLLALAVRSDGSLATVTKLFDKRNALSETLGLLFAQPDRVDEDKVAAFAAGCASSGVEPSLVSIENAIEQTQDEVAKIAACIGDLAKLPRRFGLNAPVDLDTQEALVSFLILLLETSSQALEARMPALRVVGSDVVVADAQRKAAVLKLRESEIEARLDLARARHEQSPAVLYRLSDALANGGLLSPILPQARQAEKVWRGLRRDSQSSPPRAARAQDLRDVAATLVEIDRFRNNRQLQALLGDAFEGHETDFDTIAAAARFLRKTALVMQRTGNRLKPLQETLAQADAEILQQICSGLSLDRLGQLKSVLAQARGSDTTLEEQCRQGSARIAGLKQLRQAATDLGLLPEALLPGEQWRNGTLVVTKDVAKYRKLSSDAAALKDHLGSSFPKLLKNAAPLHDAMALHRQLATSRLSPETITDLQRADSPAERSTELASFAAKIRSVCQSAADAWAKLSEVAQIDSPAFFGGEVEELPVANMAARLSRALAGEFAIGDWMRYQKTLAVAKNSRGSVVVDAYEKTDLPQPRLADIFELCLVRTLIRHALGSDASDLADMGSASMQETRARFAALDKEIAKLEALRIAASAQERRIPYGTDRGPKSEWTERALIENEVAKRKRHIPVRNLVRRAHQALIGMKPVWLMSPLTVAQYVPPRQDFFDLVVIDEASQMRPADAVGAIARARQVIVVGDPLQLPPTDFFSANSDDGDGAAQSAAEGHSSILDLGQVRLTRKRMLRWHYRSRHESLIALSNKEFYESRLVVFPSAESHGSGAGLEHQYVKGVYVGGTNPEEARAVVERARQSIERFPDRSLGIATTNLDQRELITEEFERMAATHEAVADYRARWQDTLEPLFIKNLENVQGDERDVMIISTVFGPDETTGKVAQRFGPINSEAGHRRLNVLFTRAKRQLILVTSLTPADIVPGRSTHRGVHVLKAFLEYAATGRLFSGIEGLGEADSPFEAHVAQSLRERGYECVPQVGVQGYRIDIGIRHPDYPYGFLAGIECDGKAYHSGVTVRDRDRLRQEILEGLGWRIYRIWSTDWFAHPTREMEKLAHWLEGLRAEGLNRLQ